MLMRAHMRTQYLDIFRKKIVFKNRLILTELEAILHLRFARPILDSLRHPWIEQQAKR